MKGETQLPSNVFSDNPIDGPGDRFDRDEFTGQVGNLLAQISIDGESSVIALVGPWGSGKTSILNMVRADLLRRSSPAWNIAAFSPWYFDDVSELLEKFFAQLAKLLPGNPNKSRRRRAAALLRAVSPYSSLATLGKLSIDKQIDAIARSLDGDRSIEGARDELAKELRLLPHKMLIVIDDLDRLQPSEMLQVFKLIRLIGRLPNVFYLLAFDERSILDALKSTSVANGSDARAARYLEKMVQVRLDIPTLNERQRREAFDGLLKVVLAENFVRITPNDQQRLDVAFEGNLQHGLAVPRAIYRFFAQIQAFLPLVIAETNAVDYILLAYVRTFYGTLYSRLPRWRSELTSRGSSTSSRQAQWSSRLASSGVDGDDAEDVLAVLESVFPFISDSEHLRNSVTEDDLRKRQRAGSDDYFDRYFQHAVPKHQIPDQTVMRCLGHLTGGQPVYEGPCRMLDWIQDDPVEAFRKIEHSVGLAPVVDLSPLFALFLTEYDRHNTAAIHEYSSRVQRSIENTCRDILSSYVDSDDPPEGTYCLLGDGSTGTLAADVVRGLEAKGVEASWLPALRVEVLRHLRTTIDSWDSIDVQTVRDYRELRVWIWMSPDEEVRALLQESIRSGRWGFLDVLPILSQFRLYYSSDGTGALLYAYYNQMKISDIESTLGSDFAVETAGDLLDTQRREPPDFIDEPFTPESAREYLLSCIGILRDRANPPDE